MVEQESQMKKAWDDATGYLKEFFIDLSVKYRLIHTPASLVTYAENSPYQYYIFIFGGRTQMHVAGLPWFSKHWKFENDSLCVPGMSRDHRVAATFMWGIVPLPTHIPTKYCYSIISKVWELDFIANTYI